MSGSEVVVGGRYRLATLIGSGGMGRVWLAHDELLGRQVAVKEVVYPPELTTSERDELRLRMLREGQAAGRLSHANVVAIYDVVQEGDRPWIVMEYVPSRSLYQVIKEDGPLTPRQAAEIGLSVLAALRAAHAAGVLHRDIKPGNVLLAEDRVVLTDFGLATFDGDGTITRAGLILGSAQYISPERARDGVSTPQSDLWSLGATLYAAVEGRSPYARESSMATLTALATQPPDPARRAGALQLVLDGLLQKNPRQRMDAAEAEKWLRRIANGELRAGTRRAGRTAPRQRPTNGTPQPTPVAGSEATDPTAPTSKPPMRLRTATEETLGYVERRRRRWPVWAAFLGILAVGATAILATRPWESGDPAAAPSTPAQGAITPAMGVQACLAQDPTAGTPVTPGPTALPSGYGMVNANFTVHEDPAGFAIVVPIGWRMSDLGDLMCFRDPTERKAVAVRVDRGVRGDPTELLQEGEAAWVKAAGLKDYRHIKIDETFLWDGSADLEYSYGEGLGAMHGENRMIRVGNHAFTIYWLTSDLYWNTDRAFMDVIQSSFTLTRDLRV